MYSLLIMDDGGRPICGNGGVADRVILCATFEALANPFTTTGLCILNAVVAKKGDERISIFGFFDKSGTFAVPAQTSSRTAVTPFTSAETKGLIILDWTTGAFLRNPVAAASTPIIGLDSTVSSESDAAREGQAESSAMTTKPPFVQRARARLVRLFRLSDSFIALTPNKRGVPPCRNSISDSQAEPSSWEPLRDGS